MAIFFFHLLRYRQTANSVDANEVVRVRVGVYFDFATLCSVHTFIVHALVNRKTE